MLHKILYSFFTKGSIAVVNFLILIITSKYLGISTRGEISLIILNISIIQMINEVFTGYSLVYFISKFDIRKIYYKGITFTIIATLSTNLILYLLNKQLKGYELLLTFIAIIIILNTFNCVIILAKEYMKLFNFLGILQPALLLAGIFVYTKLLHIYTVDAFLWPLFFSFIFSFAISSFFVIKYIFKHDEKKEFSMVSILKNGFYCQLAVLMYILSSRLSYYLLETKPDVGLYSTASSLIESVLIITNSITPILLAKVARTENNEQNVKFTLIFAKLCFVFSLLAMLVLYIVPDEFFTMLLGNKFDHCKPIMLLLAPGIVFLSFSGILSHYYSGTGNLKTVSFINLFGFISTLILAPILIKLYGITGAAISTNISYFITFIVSIIIFMRTNMIKTNQLFSIKDDLNELKRILASN